MAQCYESPEPRSRVNKHCKHKTSPNSVVWFGVITIHSTETSSLPQYDLNLQSRWSVCIQNKQHEMRVGGAHGCKEVCVCVVSVHIVECTLLCCGVVTYRGDVSRCKESEMKAWCGLSLSCLSVFLQISRSCLEFKSPHPPHPQLTPHHPTPLRRTRIQASAMCDTAGHSSQRLPGFYGSAFITIHNTHFLPPCLCVCGHSRFPEFPECCCFVLRLHPKWEPLKEEETDIDTEKEHGGVQGEWKHAKYKKKRT